MKYFKIFFPFDIYTTVYYEIYRIIFKSFTLE